MSGNPLEAQVSLKQSNGEAICIIPFNTVYKLIKGKAHNIMTIIDTYDFVMKNKDFIANIEKGKSTKFAVEDVI